jgi:hypothetical protein
MRRVCTREPIRATDLIHPTAHGAENCSGRNADWLRRPDRSTEGQREVLALSQDDASRRLDPATHLVASVPALAQRGLETAACDQALRRVRACSVDRFNSFSCIPASLSLRESCLHEMCTGSLGGGRRLARKRASSDPTKFFIREKVPEFREVHKPADARVGWRLCAGVMRDDRHRMPHFSLVPQVHAPVLGVNLGGASPNIDARSARTYSRPGERPERTRTRGPSQRAAPGTLDERRRAMLPRQRGIPQ